MEKVGLFIIALIILIVLISGSSHSTGSISTTFFSAFVIVKLPNEAFWDIAPTKQPIAA